MPLAAMGFVIWNSEIQSSDLCRPQFEQSINEGYIITANGWLLQHQQPLDKRSVGCWASRLLSSHLISIVSSLLLCNRDEANRIKGKFFLKCSHLISNLSPPAGKYGREAA